MAACLLRVAGGKWTTYRKMAEDCVDHASILAKLDERPCTTERLRIHGYHEKASQFGDFASYGSDAEAIQQLMNEEPALNRRLDPDLPVWASMVVVRTTRACRRS